MTSKRRMLNCSVNLRRNDNDPVAIPGVMSFPSSAFAVGAKFGLTAKLAMTNPIGIISPKYGFTSFPERRLHPDVFGCDAYRSQ